MKRVSILALFVLPVLLATGQAPAPDGKTIRITGTRLTYPLIGKWIEEYTRSHPGIRITVGRIPADSADLVIVSHSLGDGDVKQGQQSFVLTRYVQVPVVNSRRSDVQSLQQKGFDDAAFRQVYFDGAPSYTVYKRSQPACASIAFANHFGSNQQDIKGTGVTGDDRDLLDAVKKDSSGISYNNLGFVYDLTTRRPLDGITVVPIDLNGNGRIDPEENIYGTLDDVLRFVEKTHHPRILLEDVHVLVRRTQPDRDITAFLQWVITRGQEYNHAYGFINLDVAVAQAEERKLATPAETTTKK